MKNCQNKRFKSLWVCLILVFALYMAMAAAGRAEPQSPTRHGHAIEMDAGQAASFIAYNRSITLTPAQQKIFDDALTSLRAPCCAKFTMKTCCCPCNLAKSSWGLSKHLIADEHYSAPEVKEAVAQWLRVANPGGFTGDACVERGSCNLPFAKNGCGGMNEENLISHD